MRMMRAIRDDAGGTAAEYALLLPIILLFFFGIIDAGRYAWEFNKAEKATQSGARYAVVTDLVADGLKNENYSFAVDGGIPQGTVVPISDFGGITCGSTGGTVSCDCIDSSACDFGEDADSDAFGNIVAEMQLIKPDISADDVVVEYLWSGLGFSGDPNGPDVAPLVNVRLQDMDFTPITLFLFDGTIPLPEASYSLTLEDGQGDEADS